MLYDQEQDFENLEFVASMFLEIGGKFENFPKFQTYSGDSMRSLESRKLLIKKNSKNFVDFELSKLLYSFNVSR